MSGSKVTVDDKALKALLGKVSAACRDLTPPLTGWGNKLVEQTKQQFNSETDPDGDRWEDLKPSTLRQKQRLGYPSSILTRTSAMRNSIRSRASPRQLDLISDSPYLKFHQRGTSRMAKRKVLGVTSDRKNDGAGLIRVYIQSRTKR